MGIFDKIKKFTDGMDKKVENLDDSIKKLDEKLKTDESTESVEETSSDELKELEELKDAGILTEEEFQQKKEEILSLESTSSQIEEETTPDKTMCDYCNGNEWDAGDEGSDKLYQVFDEEDFEFEEPLALWCDACVDFMKQLQQEIETDYDDAMESCFVLSSEEYNQITGRKEDILDCLREWKSR